MEKTENRRAFVNGNEKVHFGNKADYSTKIIQYEFNKFYYNEIIKLLLNVYEEKIIIPEVKVNSLFARTYIGCCNLSLSEGREGLLDPSQEHIVSEFECNGVLYLLDMHTEKDRSMLMHYFLYFTYLKNQQPDEKIGHELLRIAFHYTSNFKRGCCEISIMPGDRETINNLDVNFIEPQPSNINEIYVENEIKNNIERFVYIFRNFKKHNTSLRYLLSGAPGLGKTEIIRSVISSCSKDGCVIIPSEMEGEEWLVFEFAKLFSPVLVCVDDIDLIFGRREEGSHKSLSKFLTVLDGIMQNKFFLIATTNDKKLVDLAASRPGRFDEIIDFGDFERRFYMDLIKKQAKDESILNLFTDDVLNFMEEKKVTGAYIVNLIKQTKIMKEMNKDFGFDDLMKYLNRNYKGFYKSQIKIERSFGFSKRE